MDLVSRGVPCARDRASVWNMGCGILVALAQVHPSLHSADVQELFKEQALRTAETSRAYPRSGQRYRSCHWDVLTGFHLELMVSYPW